MARLLCIAGSVISQTRLDWSDEPMSHLLEWCSILIMFGSHWTINVMIPNDLPYCYGDSALSWVIVIRLWEDVGWCSQLSSVDFFCISPSTFCLSLSPSLLFISLSIFTPTLSFALRWESILCSVSSGASPWLYPPDLRHSEASEDWDQVATEWVGWEQHGTILV